MTLKSGLTGAEIAKHNDAKSCWVIVHGKAYDVTEFLPEHPGGQKIILKYAGKDATEEYEPIHPPDTLDKYLDKSKHLGPVDMASVVVETKEEDPDEVARQERFNQRPLLEQCYNLMDFEAVARRVMKKTAWGYYSSAADDEMTLRENHAAFHRIWFRPRILVDVEHVDFSTTMLGTKVDMPFYVTATALGKLGHPEGEVVLTRAAAKHKSITKMPIILKGVQRVEDVLRAIEAGVQGVVLSNHGGRQLDFARSAIEVLAETMAVLREQGLENRIEIFIDGGVRRATDMIKALCLGAKGMEMNMRLIGCTSVDQLNPSLIDIRSLYAHGNGTPGDNLAGAVYDPLATPVQRPKAPKSSKL
ncbi:Malate dehydrogenase [Verticillium dahliae VDG1]|nr:Malate dehydrogenase [Verticillium dahliae VDG1]